MNQKIEFSYDPDKLAEGFLNAYYIFAPGEGCSREELDNADWTLRYWRESFYDWHKGRYMQVSDGDMRSIVTGYLQSLNNQTYNPPDPRIKITGKAVNDILVNLAGFDKVFLPDWREMNTWNPPEDGKITIAFLNGLAMLDNSADKAEFVEHTPKFFSLVRLPYNYDKDARCPRWEAFLDDVMEGDIERIELLQQWAGYLLSDTLKFQKFMLTAGEGGNGKTVFTTMLEKMLGEENVSHIPLCFFGDRFSLHSTLGKTLNSTSESSHGLDELCETMLKSYTSGDRMTFERKFREPVSCNPTAKVMISTNQLPNFTDKSNGIWRRMLFVPFDKCVPVDEQNPELVRELTAELPGIFNWTLKGLRNLMDDGRFIEPARCKEAISEYRKDTNPAKVFLEENYVEGFEFDGVPCGEMYQAYTAWCGQNGYHPLNASNFGKEVKRAFPNIKNVQKMSRGQRIRVCEGLSVINGSEAATSPLSDNYSCSTGIF